LVVLLAVLWLMRANKKKRLGFERAFETLRSARPIVEPNQGFKQQLLEFEEASLIVRLPLFSLFLYVFHFFSPFWIPR